MECEHIVRKRAGDESWDYCELTERPSGRIQPCRLQRGDICEDWEQIKKEREDENKG